MYKENKNEMNVYQFSVQHWTESHHSVAEALYTNANVLLTAIEKAFLSVDPNTKTYSEAMEYSYE